MKEEEFIERMKIKDYKNLEKDLLSEYRKLRDLNTRYFLGICYSEQYEKKDEAITIFKDLMDTNLRTPYMYRFVSKHSPNKIESSKILRESLKYFPNDLEIQNQLLFYLDGESKENLYIDLKEQNKLDFYGLFNALSYYYEKRKYDVCLEILDSLIQLNNFSYERDLRFLKILILYLNKRPLNKEEIDSFIVVDNNSFQGLIIRLIEIDNEDDLKTANKLFAELSYITKIDNPFIEVINYSTYDSSYIIIDNVFGDIIEVLKTKFSDNDSSRKLNIIYSFQLLYGKDRHSKQFLREMLKNLIEEMKNNDNKDLYEVLINVYIMMDDNKKFFQTYMISLGKGYADAKHFSYFGFSTDDFNFVIQYIKKNLKIYDYNADKYQVLIENLIFKLNENKKYKEIIEIIDCIAYKKLNYLKFGFEIAYAFYELGRKEEAKQIYSEYLKIHPKNDAVLNNLGLIYQSFGDLETSLKFYEKSEKIKHSEISYNNIKVCKRLIEENQKQLNLEKKALEYFETENIWIIDRIKLFYEEADESGNVICTYKKLPIILKCNNEKSQDVLNQMLEKGYLFKNKNKDYDTNANVYKINFSILKRLKEIIEENQLISSFTSNLDRFTIDELSNIEYKRVTSRLNVIRNKNIKEIFIRDYNELVFNYLTKQQKTVVLMSGTLVELILLFTLNKKKISTYKVGSRQKVKKIVEMDISEMLEVCTKENLIQNAPYNFIDGIKNFRNFIHPGKELREKKLELDKSTIELSFNIANWLILNINLK